MLGYEDFLLEIGCEELPARAQALLINALAKSFETALTDCGLAHGTIHPYVTPRRLAVFIEKLQKQTLPQKVERKGPLLSLALDTQGKPTPAGLGFAKSCGVEFARLERIASDKGECLYYCSEMSGQMATELLPALCNKVIAALPIAKAMRWGNSEVSFARPVHWIVLLFGKEIVPAKILGQNSDRLTYGHRFHHPQAISLDEPKHYEAALQKAYVVADAEKRRALIVRGLKEVVVTIKGEVTINEELLNEVTAIVEWPVVFLGQFDKHFLTVPHEALILAMQQHQKAFYVHDKQHQLLPYFMSVSNIESRDPSQVVHGNERVMNARLADAKFFFDSDRKHSLAFMAQKLDHIIFHARLGTLQDRSQRIAEFAKTIALSLHLNDEEAYRAGLLCKADLVSDMVGEFPELQGIMGGYYAAHSHEVPAVATAIAEHYQPCFALDELPQSPLGAVVAIADKLDTLVGIFAVGEIPKGDKDPYALRRLALGVLKIIVDRQWSLNLVQLLHKACELYGDKAKASVVQPVFDFMMERFKHHYIEQGVAVEIFMAVQNRIQQGPKQLQPYDFTLRVHAVQSFCCLPQNAALAAAYKRVNRILYRVGNKGDEVEVKSYNPDDKINETLLLEPNEKKLWDALQEKRKEVLSLCERKEYEDALLQLASLQSVIDDFFDTIMVMTEDKALRDNRLTLLFHLYILLSSVANLSYL